jgi:SPP1 family phage portal protein
MTRDELQKIINRYQKGHNLYSKECAVAEAYYRGDNDILKTGVSSKVELTQTIRAADNRIPRNFHALLINQKASYLFSFPPMFDVGDKAINDKVTQVLGDDYFKTCKDLCVDASNKAVAWLHYWMDNAGFQYAPVDAKQIIPIYSTGLKRQLDAVIRQYDIWQDDASDKITRIWEYWDSQHCYSFAEEDVTGQLGCCSLKEYCCFEGLPGSVATNVYIHGFGEVPFIPFYNNNILTNDLKNIKALIDAYDKVFSGFLNDLEDIQEVIFVITNYGGADLDEFLGELKKYKAIKIDNAGDGDKSGVDTLRMEIPVEARKEFLEICRKAIFEQGQGVDPNPEKFSNTSGEALKFLYSLLDMKAGITETEFRSGFNRLVRAICKTLGYNPVSITQTWTRTYIKNDTELANIAKESVGIISEKSILKYHPWVDNPEDELEELKRERAEAEQSAQAEYEPFQNEPGSESDSKPSSESGSNTA